MVGVHLGEKGMAAEEVILGAEGLFEPALTPWATGDPNEIEIMEGVLDYSSQNVAVLSILLALALTANLAAFPVILFRRTK